MAASRRSASSNRSESSRLSASSVIGSLPRLVGTLPFPWPGIDKRLAAAELLVPSDEELFPDATSREAEKEPEIDGPEW